jgi:hypothetical protein
MQEIGNFIRFDLNDPEDCIDLVKLFGWTNSQIRDAKSLGHRYQSISKELLK